MSRWLKGVGQLLEKLDDGAETARAAVDGLQRLGGGGEEGSSDEEDDDEYYDDEEDESGSEDGEGKEEGEEEEEFVELEGPGDEGESKPLPLFANDDDDDDDQPASDVSLSTNRERETPRPSGGAAAEIPLPATPSPQPPPPPLPPPRPSPKSPETPEESNTADVRTTTPQREQLAQQSPHPPTPPPPPPPLLPQQQQQRSQRPPPPPPSSSGALSVSSSTTPINANATSASASAAASKRLLKEYKRTIERLERTSADLVQQNASLQKEMDAQQLELLRAATDMQEERQEHDLEARELQEQHQEELERILRDHGTELDGVRGELQSERDRRAREGGNWNEELQSLSAQQEEAAGRVQETQDENVLLHGRVGSLQSQVRTLQGALETAREAEVRAEEAWEKARTQSQQERISRQERESELERQVQELTALQQQSQHGSSSSTSANKTDDANEPNDQLTYYKKLYEETADELVAVQTQLQLSTQEGRTLQEQLSQVLQERDQQASDYEHQQRASDSKVGELNLQVKRLESALREWKQREATTTNTSTTGGDNDNDDNITSDENSRSEDNERMRHALHQAEQAQKQVKSLSDQLLRQQGSAESTKSENIALRGRLQAATQRADAAELELTNINSSTSLDVEGGGSHYTGSKTRRRVKSGGLRGLLAGGGPSVPGPRSATSSRSIRAALGWRGLLHVQKGTPMEHVAVTIDAVDQWMLELSSVLRYEPLARLGCFLYLAIVHMWCFVLVCFHTVEAEHGDLGALTASHHQHPGAHPLIATSLDAQQPAAAVVGS